MNRRCLSKLSSQLGFKPTPGERGGERVVLQLEVRFFKRLVQIMKSHVSPCWELDPSITGLAGWKHGYVLRKPGGLCGRFKPVRSSLRAPCGTLLCDISLLRLMEKCFKLFPQAWSTLISHGGREESADRQSHLFLTQGLRRLCLSPWLVVQVGWRECGEVKWMTSDSWVN